MYNNAMIELKIPGRGELQLEHLVCDVNGTLAVDGELLEGISRRLKILSDRLQIHLLTADTHGRQAMIDQQLGRKAVRILPENEVGKKAAYIQQLGASQVIAIGQGANDAQMLAEAALGICILSVEGTAVTTLLSADLVVKDIYQALDLLENPIRLVSTLRK